MEVEVVGRTKKQIGPDTEVEAKQKERVDPLKYKPFSAFSDAPPSAYGLDPSSEDAAPEKNSIFNFKSNSMKTQMKSYDPFFPSSKKKEGEAWVTMESPHLPDLKDTLAIRYDGDPTIPPLVKQLAASPAPSLPPFHTYAAAQPTPPPRSQRRSDDWDLPRMQNGHASFFRLGAPSNSNLEVLVEKSGAKSPGRKMTKFGEGKGASPKDQASKKNVMDLKVHSTESDRMIAEALEKIQQRRMKSERYYDKHSSSADVKKDSDYDAEKLIEQANITDFLKL